MSDEGMSDAELHKLVSCDHDKGCGMRYAACSCGYEKALESALPLLLARATAAERERDRLYLVAKANNDLARRVTAQRDDMRKALALFADHGCPVCSGDCASANPPVMSCPMQNARAALTANHSAPTS